MNVDLLYAELFEPFKKNTLDELNNLLDRALLSTKVQVAIEHQGIIPEEEIILIDVEDEVIEKEQLSGNFEHACPEDAEIELSITNAQKNGGLQECFVKLLQLPDNSDGCTLLEFSEAENLNVQIGKSSENEESKCDNQFNDTVTKPKRVKSDKKKTNIGEKSFKCNICKFTTAYNKILMNHLGRFHTGEKPYSCNKCDFCATSVGNLKIHKRKAHSSVKPFTCDVCKFSTTLKYTFECHMQEHNKNTYKKNLLKHMASHENVKKFSCSFCEFQCGSKARLKNHTETHTAKKIFACNSCNYISKWKGNLNTHSLTHSVVTPFTCYICMRDFKHKTSLRKHMKVVHNM